MSDIIDRLEEACKGYPAAWPHRLLHDAISEIERLRGVAQAPLTVGVLHDIFITMRHARTFITSREKMHPTGVELWDRLFAQIEALQTSSVSSTPSEPAQAQSKCDCAVMCQDLGIQGGCRYIKPSRTMLRKLVDLTWNHVTESQEVPSTNLADELIDRASLVPSTNRVCAKCGCETMGEEALVNGVIWCHPCADGCSFSSTNCTCAALGKKNIPHARNCPAVSPADRHTEAEGRK